MKVLKKVIGVLFIIVALVFYKGLSILRTRKINGIRYVKAVVNSGNVIGMTKQQMRGLSGIFVQYATKETLVEMRRNKQLSTQQRLACVFANVGYTVCVIKDLLPTNLTKTEIDCMIAHEFGHIVNKHLEKSIEDGQSGVLLVSQYETEADDYASQQYGKSTMRSALIKMRDHMLDLHDEHTLELLNQRIDKLTA